MAVLVTNLSKRFDDGTVAVNNIDLKIAKGEFFTLLGPSGCGKTTTLRLIAGLEVPTAGTVSINGRDVTHLDPGKRDVAMVFQSYALYPHMTAFENMTLNLRVSGVSKEEAKTRATETAQLLDIERLLDRKPRKLSGGERQRVALGRAIIRHPALFLMDEPLSNLDLKLREVMRTELKRLHQRLGITTVYVTHDQTEALILSDRVAVMHAGKVQQVAGPTDMYENPANLFVAEFIGSPSINLIKAEIGQNDVLLHGYPPLPWEGSGSGGVVIGVRPEDALLVTPEKGTLRGVIDFVEPSGAVVYAFVRLEGLEGALMKREHLVSAVDVHRDISPGSPVGIRLREERLRLFDLESGARIPGSLWAIKDPCVEARG